MSASSNHKLKQAHARLRAGDAAGARALCEQVLKRAPGNPEALSLLGSAHLMNGHPAAALAPLQQAVSAESGGGMALEHLGLAHLMLGQFTKAESALRRAASLPGAPASVEMRLGAALLHQHKHDEAVRVLRRALAREPDSIDCHLNLGQVLAQKGDVAAAKDHFQAILRIDAHHVDAAFNLGVLSLSQGEFDTARQWFERVIHQSPRHADAHVNLGIVLQNNLLYGDALECFHRALQVEPGHVPAHHNLAHTLALQGRLDDARERYLMTLRIAPNFAAAHEGLASVCLALGRAGEAIGHLRATLQSEPDNINALSALAGALFEAGQLEEAETTAQRACSLNPTAAAPCHATLANIYFVRGDLDRTIAALESGYAHTNASSLLGMLTYQLRQACDWTRWQAAWELMAPEVEENAALGSPFWLLCEPTTAHQQLVYTRRWAEARFKSIAAVPSARLGPRAHQRLRIGYLSSDLQEHAAAYLVSEVLELHNRAQFEVFAYSHGPDDGGAMRQRLRAGCEHFIDIAWEPDDVAAERIRGDALDLLVDLKGYTAGDRLTIMARRPCSVQVAWLGYPGTTGAAFMDYLIADPFIIPPGEESHYSERVVRMPHCYQANDRKRAIAVSSSRADYGLPDRAFVFCCFNQAYKITPDVFAVWMRLLKAIPHSVLWLIESNRLAKHNLLAAAQTHGVPAERLVFAPRLPYAQHLARYRAADLALDTFPYTSHTILSDALWCGCPTIGLCGTTFASRVSGSLLTAAGLPDLVTYTIADYEQLALRIAMDPPRMQQIRTRVARARDHSSLFDSTTFTRDLEQIYLGLVNPVSV